MECAVTGEVIKAFVLAYLTNRHRGGPIEEIPKREVAVEQYVKEICIVTFQGYVIPREIVQFELGRAFFYLGMDVHGNNLVHRIDYGSDNRTRIIKVVNMCTSPHHI